MPADDPASGAASAGTSANGTQLGQLPVTFWAMRFATPDGGELLMQSLKGKPLLINFWATWCPPCIRELPALNRFYLAQAGKGWRVVGLAIDSAEPVRDFLKRLPLDFDIGIAGLDGTELVRQLGNNMGGLPYSVLLDSNGQLVARKLGELSEQDLAQWAQLA